jgi:hypothetical protein
MSINLKPSQGSPGGMHPPNPYNPLKTRREQNGMQGAPTTLLEAMEKADPARLTGKAKGRVVSQLAELRPKNRPLQSLFVARFPGGA